MMTWHGAGEVCLDNVENGGCDYYCLPCKCTELHVVVLLHPKQVDYSAVY